MNRGPKAELGLRVEKRVRRPSSKNWQQCVQRPWGQTGLPESKEAKQAGG